MLTISVRDALLTLLGTIIIGALGSGLWDVLFKRWYGIIAQFAVRIATFGIATSRDSLYLEAAKGPRDRAGGWLIYVVILFGLPWTVALQPFWHGPTSAEILRDVEEAEVARHPITEADVNALPPEQLRALKAKLQAVKDAQDTAEQERINHVKSMAATLAGFERFKWPIMIGIIFGYVNVLFSAIRLTAVSGIITGYQQRLSACRPFLTQEEQWVIESRFARMKSRSDYAKLMEDLLTAIKAENLRVPPSLFS